MRIACFIADRHSASSRLRVLQYVELLRADGYQVRVCVTRPSKYLMRPAWLPRARSAALLYGLAGAALIIVQRVFQICVWLPRDGLAMLQKDMLFRTRIDLLERLVFALAQIRGTRVVFDVDDAIYLGTSQVPLPGLMAKVKWIAARADLVLAGSEPIARDLREAASHVEVAPTGILTGPAPRRSYSADDQGLRLAWTGTAANLRYLLAVAGPLNEFTERSGARIVIVTRLASLPPGAACTLARAEFTDWSPGAEADVLEHADIALAPLDDDPFSRARCGGKLLSYFLAALPVIASPVGAQASMVRDGETGLVASTPGDWLAGLTRLSASSQLRQRLGQAGRRYLEENLAGQRLYPAWRDWLTGAADR